MPGILTNVDNPLDKPVDKCVGKKRQKSVVAFSGGR